jgi:integrase
MSKVTLRKKKIKKGKISLYLDFYPPIYNPETKKYTRRDFLKIYLYDKPITEIEKTENKENKILAESIRAKRQLDIANERFGFLIKKKEDFDFISYFKKIISKKKESNYSNWNSTLKYLMQFTNEKLKGSDITKELCENFKEFLLNKKTDKSGRKLSNNSAASYFNKFKSALRDAFREGLLENDINSKIRSIKEEETHREFLSLDELKILVKTDCKNPLIKKAALFSAYSGLRFSDIKNLKWKDILYSKENGYYIQFIQQKTKGAEVLPITEEAFLHLGETGELHGNVFDGLVYSDQNNELLKNWIADAGINKEITFHNFRHSYATILLSMGVDIYTVSKLLGHKSIKTTEIYAKVVDINKISAVNKISLK